MSEVLKIDGEAPAAPCRESERMQLCDKPNTNNSSARLAAPAVFVHTHVTEGTGLHARLANEALLVETSHIVRRHSYNVCSELRNASSLVVASAIPSGPQRSDSFRVTRQTSKSQKVDMYQSDILPNFSSTVVNVPTSPPDDGLVRVDFKTIMFFSTGGAVLATNYTPDGAAELDPTMLGTRKRALWSDYRPFARRLFWRYIFPVCALVYLSMGLMAYLATIRAWACKDTLVLSLASMAAILAMCVIVWTGSVAFRMRKHPLVFNRGLVYVFQVHVGFFFGVPAIFPFILSDAGIFIPSKGLLCAMLTCTAICIMVYISAIIARQRQMVHLFGLTAFAKAPKHTYRNAVALVVAMYVFAICIRLVLYIEDFEPSLYNSPLFVTDVFCFVVWFILAYQSRHASAQFSDYDQSRRLFVLFIATLLGCHVWSYAQAEALVLQHFLVYGLMCVFLLDSYLSLLYFIHYMLDPNAQRKLVSSSLQSTTAMHVNAAMADHHLPREQVEATRTLSSNALLASKDVIPSRPRRKHSITEEHGTAVPLECQTRPNYNEPGYVLSRHNSKSVQEEWSRSPSLNAG